jgi:hypothetical protein
MTSRKSSRLLDLERDLPTDNAAVSALRKAKVAGGMDLEVYLEFLASLDAAPRPAVRRKKGFAGAQPFVL